MKQRELAKNATTIVVLITAITMSAPHVAGGHAELATLKAAPKPAEAAKAPAEKANSSAPCLKVGESWKG